jgi:hypothetical protein
LGHFSIQGSKVLLNGRRAMVRTAGLWSAKTQSLTHKTCRWSQIWEGLLTRVPQECTLLAEKSPGIKAETCKKKYSNRSCWEWGIYFALKWERGRKKARKIGTLIVGVMRMTIPLWEKQYLARDF